MKKSNKASLLLMMLASLLGATTTAGLMQSARAETVADAPNLIERATKECSAALAVKRAYVAQKYHPKWLDLKIQSVHVGADGVYGCDAVVTAILNDALVREIWSVSAYLGQPPASFNGNFAGEKL